MKMSFSKFIVRLLLNVTYHCIVTYNGKLNYVILLCKMNHVESFVEMIN